MLLDESTTILARTPSVLDELLDGLGSEWLNRNDGPGTWSTYDIVGHLLHGEATDWMPRIRMILQHGTKRPFEPFDRAAMQGQEPLPFTVLLARFRTARAAGLAEFTSLKLTPDDLQKRGLHPEFGEVTLEQLVATWVAHDLTHIAQISEVLARRYRETVGPWRAYLPALDRAAAAE